MNEICYGSTEYKIEIVKQGNESYFKISINPFPVEILDDEELNEIYLRLITEAVREAADKHSQTRIDRKYK